MIYEDIPEHISYMFTQPSLRKKVVYLPAKGDANEIPAIIKKNLNLEELTIYALQYHCPNLGLEDKILISNKIYNIKENPTLDDCGSIWKIKLKIKENPELLDI